MELRVRNVQQAYVRGLALIRERGEVQQTRNGPAWVVPEPVLTVYERPWERVLLDPQRDANPFFHLLEAVWMLAGRQDVKSLARYNTGMRPFSDDGETFHGAYGHRWRHHFGATYLPHTVIDGMDQIRRAVKLLRANPLDRRVVISMWDPVTDLGQDGLDFPCNTQIYLRARPISGEPGHHELDLTVTCRSNDAIWGAYGSNAVHFSVLQEFLSAACGFRMGRMYQLSNNLHAYDEALSRVGQPDWDASTQYEGAVPLRFRPLFTTRAKQSVKDGLQELEDVWDRKAQPQVGFLTANGFGTLEAMQLTWDAFKKRDRKLARDLADTIPCMDWRVACREWLERRYSAKETAT